MLSVLEHPEHCCSPSFFAQKEHGVMVVFLSSLLLHAASISMQDSSVASPLSIRALAMMRKPFTVEKGSPST